jgi:hypothetical protein
MAQTSPTNYLARLITLQNSLARIKLDQDDENDKEAYERDRDLLQSILRDTCMVLREAVDARVFDIDTVIALADGLINEGVNLAYEGVDSMFDFLPSFAHSEATSPLVEDGNQELFLRA